MWPFKKIKEYEFEVIVQFDEAKKPCVCGVSFKRLNNVYVKAFNGKQAILEANRKLNKAYPKLIGFFQLELRNSKMSKKTCGNCENGQYYSGEIDNDEINFDFNIWCEVHNDGSYDDDAGCEYWTPRKEEAE